MASLTYLLDFVCCFPPTLRARCVSVPNVDPSSVVHHVVVSLKLSKIGPLLSGTLHRNCHCWFCCCIQILPKTPPAWGKLFYFQMKKISSNIYTASSCSTWHQTTAVVNRARPSSHSRCCQLLTTECDRRNLLLPIIVHCVDSTSDMTPKLNKRQASFFSQWWYSRLFTEWPPTWKIWKSDGTWKWSGKSQEKYVIACGVLPQVVQWTQNKHN